MTAAEKETDVKLRQKIAYLQRLLILRVRFMTYATGVDVYRDKENVIVRWDMSRGCDTAGCEVIDYEMIEFPIAHLNRRIRHYKDKFRKEFNKRHLKNGKTVVTLQHG